MKRVSTKKTPPQEEEQIYLNQKKHSPFFSLVDVLILVVVFISYGASIFNGYALDDFIVLVKNNFVQNGISGIVNIFSKDTFAGMTEQNLMVLEGGRYRPLSLVTFALEQQFFGNAPMLSHFINVLIYALIGVFLFRILKDVIQLEYLTALITTLLFIALPVHSEAVVNIKGRDDLMCFLFFLLSLLQLFKYHEFKNKSALLWSVVFYLLSLFSKESAITFLVVYPLTLYFFTGSTLKRIIAISFPYLIVALFFLFVRYLATKHNSASVIATDVFNNPFVFMTAMQRYATIVFCMLLYLKLIFYPVHLSYDYNYNQISTCNFMDAGVLFSIALHVVLIAIALFLFKRKSIYSFAILFYFITFSVFSNVFFSIGALVAERFMLVPSLAVCIIMVKLYFDGIKKQFGTVSEKKRIIISCILPFVIVLMSSYRNSVRCADWKDNNALFIADVKSVPNNAKANLNAAIAYIEIGNLEQEAIRKQNFDSAKKYLLKGIDILPTFTDGYMNMGVVYNWELNYDSAEVWWNRARAINPRASKFVEYDKVLSQHYFQTGMKKGIAKDYDESIVDLLKAAHYDSLNAELLYNLGGAYFSINDFENAKRYWKETLQINPANEQASKGLEVANQRLK